MTRLMPAAVLAAGMFAFTLQSSHSAPPDSSAAAKTAAAAETNSLVNDFYTYPNPFSISADFRTTFHYALTDPAKLDIRIYTRSGELVWSKEIPSDESVGSSELTYWYGTNDSDQPVAFGSYICKIIATPFGGGTSYSQTTVIGVKP